jgi:hypothetical protein
MLKWAVQPIDVQRDETKPVAIWAILRSDAQRRETKPMGFDEKP